MMGNNLEDNHSNDSNSSINFKKHHTSTSEKETLSTDNFFGTIDDGSKVLVSNKMEVYGDPSALKPPISKKKVIIIGVIVLLIIIGIVLLIVKYKKGSGEVIYSDDVELIEIESNKIVEGIIGELDNKDTKTGENIMPVEDIIIDEYGNIIVKSSSSGAFGFWVASDSSSNMDTISITEAGTYGYSGGVNCISIETEGPVVLNLSDAEVTCDSGPAINVKKASKVNIVLDGTIYVTSTTSAGYDGAIYSKSDLGFSGNGTMKLNSNLSGIVSKGNIVFNGGQYNIYSGNIGIKSDKSIVVMNGDFFINSSEEGIKTTNGDIVLSGGKYSIRTTLDAISSSAVLSITNGSYTIIAGGGSGSTLKKDVTAKGLRAVKQIQITGGTFKTISSVDDCVFSEGDIYISNAIMTMASSGTGIHANGLSQIVSGIIKMTSVSEGLSASTLNISSGTFEITSSGDGINGAGGNDTSLSNSFNERGSSTGKVQITGGTFNITAKEDGVDSSSNIIITNGNVYISAGIDGNVAMDAKNVIDISGGMVVATSPNNVFTQSKEVNKTITNSPGIFVILSNSTTGLMNYGSVSYTPTLPVKEILIVGNSLVSGSSYVLSVGGASYGAFTISESVNLNPDNVSIN